MQDWHVFVHSDRDCYFVMIRNHNTSRCLVTFGDKETATRQANRLNTYPWAKLHELYLEAIKADILMLKHDLDLSGHRIKVTDIRKAEDKGYNLYVWVLNKEVLVVKNKKKYELEGIVKTWALEYTNEELVQKVREHVISKR
jgi:hypothetical protein